MTNGGNDQSHDHRRVYSVGFVRCNTKSIEMLSTSIVVVGVVGMATVKPKEEFVLVASFIVDYAVVVVVS